jgi:hypothetical protein
LIRRIHFLQLISFSQVKLSAFTLENHRGTMVHVHIQHMSTRIILCVIFALLNLRLPRLVFNYQLEPYIKEIGDSSHVCSDRCDCEWFSQLLALPNTGKTNHSPEKVDQFPLRHHLSKRFFGFLTVVLPLTDNSFGQCRYLSGFHFSCIRLPRSLRSIHELLPLEL